MGFKMRSDRDFEEIAVLIIAFVVCDRLGHIFYIFILRILKIAISGKLTIRNF